MKSLSITAALGLSFVVFVLAPSPARAFGLSGVGARVGNVDPQGAGDTFMAGGNLELEESGTRLHLEPGLMVWSSDGIRDIKDSMTRDILAGFEKARIMIAAARQEAVTTPPARRTRAKR